MNLLSILPVSASAYAQQVDALYLFLVGMSVFFLVLIGVLITIFSLKYRRRSAGEVPAKTRSHYQLEIMWTVIPLILVMVLFFWGARLFVRYSMPPNDAVEILVTGKQWMWKIQHPDGRREINNLHIPVDQAVKLTMTSEDVIHSFYVPAFRVKADVLPGRYTTLWFRPTEVGRYHLFCAEYCGTEHSLMGGLVYVMSKADFEVWQKADGGAAGVGQLSPAAAGEALFKAKGCAACHTETPAALAPSLHGMFGHTVKLNDGTEVTADENYLHESIINSQAKIVEGFLPIMPVFQGLLTEEEIQQLIAYIKSLTADKGEGS